jgi:hemoglobin
MRHARVPVNTGTRDAWMRSMRIALAHESVNEGMRRFLDEKLGDVANFLRNEPG